MARMVYFVLVHATSNESGKPPLDYSFGPFHSLREAGAKLREQQETIGESGYKYDCFIQHEVISE